MTSKFDKILCFIQNQIYRCRFHASYIGLASSANVYQQQLNKIMNSARELYKIFIQLNVELIFPLQPLYNLTSQIFWDLSTN